MSLTVTALFMDILDNLFSPLSECRLPQTDDCSRVYQRVNFPLHLAACIRSYTASISHALFGCPCTFHHGPTPWTRKAFRTDSSKWGKISAGSVLYCITALTRDGSLSLQTKTSTPGSWLTSYFSNDCDIH